MEASNYAIASFNNFCKLQIVPMIPMIPPASNIIVAVMVQPCNRMANRPGRMNAISVPLQHPTKSNTSPKLGAANAITVIMNHNLHVTIT